jgi:hypothetical protein
MIRINGVGTPFRAFSLKIAKIFHMNGLCLSGEMLFEFELKYDE